MKRSIQKQAGLALLLAVSLLAPEKTFAFIAELLVLSSESSTTSAEIAENRNFQNVNEPLTWDMERREFVQQNLDEILMDMASGGGEHLVSLALLEGCRTHVIPQLARVMQQNFQQLYSSRKPSPEAVLLSFEKQIEDDPLLRTKCNGIPVRNVDPKRIGSPTGYATGHNPASGQLLTGSYTSIRKPVRDAEGTATSPMVTLEHHGSWIIGTFTDPDGRISGAIEGDEIVFGWVSADGDTGDGQWTISADGTTLKGTWSIDTYIATGTWNLSRIDQGGASRPAQTLPSPFPEVAGTYQVRVFRLRREYGCFLFRKNFRVELTQQGNKVQGTFDSGIGGAISGFIDGNRIIAHWHTARCPAETYSVWTIDADGAGLHGKGDLDFEWTLTREQ